MSDDYLVMIYPGPPRFVVIAIGGIAGAIAVRRGATVAASFADYGEARAFRDRLVTELEAEEAGEAPND